MCIQAEKYGIAIYKLNAVLLEETYVNLTWNNGK